MPTHEDRHEYRDEALLEEDVASDPIEQFGRWFGEAQAADEAEVNAMTLATTGHDGQPTARIVLLRVWDARGFGFYTNYGGRKAEDIDVNPRGALVFFWPRLERQVRVEGLVRAMPDEEVTAYFRSRPRSAQLAAWTSRQSDVIASRQELEQEFERMQQRFAHCEVPVPSFWGGYRLVPTAIEFWQGRPHRLNDRLCYRRADEEDAWSLSRLAP